MKKNILIGAAWPYANLDMHIGHAVALLPSDIIARYYRLKGDNVFFVSGTDAHGSPITVRAKEEGISPLEVANKYHDSFVKSFDGLNFSYDLYTTTTDSWHKEKVQEIFLKIKDNGYIYEKEELEPFCEQCDKFLSDREFTGVCIHCAGTAKGDQCDDCLTTLSSQEVKDKICNICGAKPIDKPNKHLYFKLSAFQDLLTDYIKQYENTWRKNAVNESKKYLNWGLIDRAATRDIDWGVEIPVRGYDDKRIYVWIEAVLGYLTTTLRVAKEQGIDIEPILKDQDNTLLYMVHGKDNIPFHTIFYPALLKAIDKDYVKPTHIISSEYLNMNDTKMSKSKGNLIPVNELLQTYESDTTRYYFIANNPEKKDNSFSLEDFINTHNKFLVGVIGNFVNRNLSFIDKKFDGVIKAGTIDEKIKTETVNAYKEIGALIEQGELRNAIEKATNYVVMGNKYYDDSQPWIHAKENSDKFNDISYTCAYIMANMTNLLSPFIPNGMDKLKGMLEIDNDNWSEVQLSGDIRIKDLELLYQRIDNK